MENVTSLSSSLSKQKDYINCPATLATCSTLNPSHKLDTLLADDVNEAVFQVNLAHIMVPSKDAKLTREDHRLFTRLMVADASGAIMVDAGSKVMLNLAGLQEGETTSICDSFKETNFATHPLYLSELSYKDSSQMQMVTRLLQSKARLYHQVQPM